MPRWAATRSRVIDGTPASVNPGACGMRSIAEAMDRVHKA